MLALCSIMTLLNNLPGIYRNIQIHLVCTKKNINSILKLMICYRKEGGWRDPAGEVHHQHAEGEGRGTHQYCMNIIGVYK